MSPASVWVVTDQKVHHGPHVAFVKRFLADRGQPNERVRHIFIPKETLKSSKVLSVGRDLLAEKVPGDARIIVFRDSECRDEGMLGKVQEDMERLAGALSARWPHVACIVLNPMSEGAMLILDEWLEILLEAGPLPHENRALLARMTQEKRRGKPVHKDTFEDVGKIGSCKRRLNEAWAQHIESSPFPSCPVVCFQDVIARLDSLLPLASPRA